MDEKTKVNDVVDTTDCLEAIGAFKAMKNLFFTVTFICLVVLQGVFWLNYLGYVDASDTPCRASCVVESAVIDNVSVVAEIKLVETVAADKEVKAVVKLDEHAENAVAGLGDAAHDHNADGHDEHSGHADSDGAVVQDETPVPDEIEKASASSIAKYLPKYEHACIAIRVCNFVLVIAATIYCLILLMSIKISLIGRLGGISHISRAFFLSMFALIILLPWQCVFDGVVIGAIYTPAELFSKWVLTDDSTIVCQVIYFARFAGMWAISFLLLFSAQVRSAKWSKTTLRRLGILR